MSEPRLSSAVQPTFEEDVFRTSSPAGDGRETKTFIRRSSSRRGKKTRRWHCWHLMPMSVPNR